MKKVAVLTSKRLSLAPKSYWTINPPIVMWTWRRNSSRNMALMIGIIGALRTGEQNGTLTQASMANHLLLRFGLASTLPGVRLIELSNTYPSLSLKPKWCCFTANQECSSPENKFIKAGKSPTKNILKTTHINCLLSSGTTTTVIVTLTNKFIL